MNSPTLKAMVVIKRSTDGASLVSRNSDTNGREYERPLGGHIEYGERAIDAARREIREEIGQELKHVNLIDVIENIFDFEDRLLHEVIFVFRAQFVDDSAYDVERWRINDDPSRLLRVSWRSPETKFPRLVPTRINDL